MTHVEYLKEIILDYQELVFPTGIPRRISISSISGKVTVVIGARRSGKTTFLYQIMGKLTDSGIDRRNILYLNFFDDRLHDLIVSGPAAVAEAYFSLYPEKQKKEKIYFFFDEIQIIPGWEAFVERLQRTQDCEIYITGSSAHMRGRAVSWEMFPFSFMEFLDFKKIDGSLPLSTGKRLTVQKAFGEFWENGGFPEVSGLERMLRIKIHQEYWGVMIFRDLVERHNIAHPKAVSDLAHRLIENAASLYSINNLTGYLKSLGHRAPKSSVADYLKWFEDAYILFSVQIFDASAARRNTNPKKIYCIDHALAVSLGSGMLVNSGHLLENLVFTGLRRITSEIYYYKSSSGRETDFIALLPDKSRMLVQVCESLIRPETLKREVSALVQAMSEMKIKKAFIVTRTEDETISVEPGIIDVVPAWRFLLSLPSA